MGHQFTQGGSGSARMPDNWSRTPLEQELFHDLAGEALGEVSAALSSPFPRAALQLRFVARKERRLSQGSKRLDRRTIFDCAEALFDHAVERLAEEMLDQFVLIAEARTLRRTERERGGALA